MAATAKSHSKPDVVVVSPSKATNNVHGVLKILSSRLDTDGNIRDSKDAAYITLLMGEAVKLVDRCMFLNVLLATKSSVLTAVLDAGGWATLHSWLQEYKIRDVSSTFLVELLKLFKLLPVTVELLRQNTCAKDIKQLVKCPNEQVASTAKSIIARWMERVKKASKDSSISDGSKHSEKSSSSHKSKSSSSSSSSSKDGSSSKSLSRDSKNVTSTKDDVTELNIDTDPSRVRTLCDSPDHISAKFNQQTLSSSSRPDATTFNAVASDDSNSSTSASVDAADTAENRRPKTVKMIGSKMRSTGKDDSSSNGGRLLSTVLHDFLLILVVNNRLKLHTLAPSGLWLGAPAPKKLCAQ